MALNVKAQGVPGLKCNDGDFDNVWQWVFFVFLYYDKADKII